MELKNHRTKTESWKVRTVRTFSKKLKSANQSPNELNRSALDLVEATTSQYSGNRKYAVSRSMTTVSSQLVRRGRAESSAGSETPGGLAGASVSTAVMSDGPFVGC